MDELTLQLQPDENLYANYRPVMVPNVCVLVKKTIPGSGTISVNNNQELKPDDIIAKFTNTAGFSMVNLANQLGVSAQSANLYLERPMGSTIYKGELLARKKGLLKEKVVLSPTDGVIEKYDNQTGDLRLKFLSKEAPLVSGVYGIVVGVNQLTREVLIKTLATHIFGIIGSGIERGGFLSFVSQGNDYLVQANQINDKAKGRILVAGSLVYNDALIKAAGLGVSGIITGGIEFDTMEKLIGNIETYSNMNLRLRQDSGLSIVVTEGFGAIPLSEEILKTLQSYEDRFVFINGNLGQIHLPSLDPDSILKLRKIALPLSNPSSSVPEITIKEITVGASARVVWPPFMGSYGKIVGIDQTATTLESGIKTFLITLETSKRKIKVPYNNIELV